MTLLILYLYCALLCGLISPWYDPIILDFDKQLHCCNSDDEESGELCRNFVDSITTAAELPKKLAELSPIPVVDIFLLHCKIQLLANTTTITIHFQAVSHVHACIHIIVGEW